MELRAVLDGIEYRLISGDLSKEVASVEYDSRKAASGSLFICVRGFTVDGHSFAEKACEQGASALVVDSNRENFPDDELAELTARYGVCIVET